MRKTIQRCAASLPRSLSIPQSVHTPAIHRLRHQIVAWQCSRSQWMDIRQIHTSPVCQQQAAAVQTDMDDASENKGDISRFDELQTRNLVHPALIRALTRDMGLETMTEVQRRTISEALRGDDVIAQAKTGTGKTLAFLIPVIQRIVSVDPQLAVPARGRRGPRTTADDIRALIISPTRELAEQIAVEASKLVAHTGMIVQTAVGGTQKMRGLRAIQQQGCHILVGTPGRLKDILTDPYTRVEAPDLSALVLDEADRLLDAGFWPEIQEISRLLPDPLEKDRQTMMFSATVPKEVVSLVRSTLKPGFNYVQCVADNEDPTHPNVTQRVVTVLGFENSLPALVELCQKCIDASKEPGGKPFKALVYFNSTAEVALALSALRALAPPQSQSPDAFGARTNPHPWQSTRILEIHSKLSQSARTNAAETFRRAESAILLSSDVTARGMDFPNVTHVIQVGLPQSREQYIHRVGRTARAGKEGDAWLLLNQLEAEEARSKLRNLPLKKDNTTLETPKLDLTKEAQVPVAAGRILSMFQTAMRRVPAPDKAAVYRAQLGVYGWYDNKQALVDYMNNLARFGWGMPEPPLVSPMLVNRLGMGRIQGLNVGEDPTRQAPPGRGGGFGGRSGGFGGRDDGFGRSEAFGARDGGFGGSRNDRFGDAFDRRGGSGGARGGRGGRSGSFSRPPPSSGGRGGRSFDRQPPRDDPFGM